MYNACLIFCHIHCREQQLAVLSFQTQNQNLYLQSYGLHRRNSRGDGNCLFRSVSVGLIGNEDLYTELRQTAVTYMRQNIEEFRPFFDENSINLELDNLEKDGTYAGQESIIALSRAIGINIYVTYGGHPQDNRVFTMEHTSPGTGLPGETLHAHIIYSSMGGGHYDAAVDYVPSAAEIQTDFQSNSILNDKPLKPLTSKFKETTFSKLTNTFPQTKELQNPQSSFLPSSLTCKFCDKTLSSKSSLKRHCIRYHKDQTHVETKDRKLIINCLVSICNIKFRTIKDLVYHLNKDHEANIKQSFHEFGNFKEFSKWKETEEINNNIYFKKARSETNTKKGRKIQFVCNRNGFQKIIENRKRKPNLKGSCKINTVCPARMYVTDYPHKVTVDYIQTHTHSVAFDQTKYLPMPKSIRNEISQKLSLGIPVNTILNDIRQNVGNLQSRENEEIKYYQFVNRKNIMDMKRKITDNIFKKHEDDATSTMLWVQYLQALTNSPVLLYKKQHQVIPSLPLASEDFILILMTYEQANVYEKFSERIVCVDSTHKTNIYDFKLISLLVIDEFHKGYPVAFCLSNKEDTTVLTLLFTCVKERCPMAIVKKLMSDDDVSGINGVRTVYGHNVQHYLCTWHVHQAWRRKLASVSNQIHKLEIYFFLNCLLNAKSTAEFEKFYEKFSTKYHTLEPNFMKYFDDVYMSNGVHQKWALHCREQDLRTEITTNMYLESFHNKLKTIFMDRKQNKRIDKLIYILLEMEKDYYLNRLKNIKYGGIETPSPTERHESSRTISDDFIHVVNENTFTIQSSTNGDIFYTVAKVNDKCTLQTCFQKCNTPPCKNLCAHIYTCSCPDENLICKHIHKVHSLSYVEHENDCDADIELFHTSEYNQESENIRHEHLLQRFQAGLQTLQNQVKDPKLNNECLESIVRKIEDLTLSTQAHIDNINSETLRMEEAFQVSSTKKLDKQPTFKRTSKVRRKGKSVLRKPTEEEKKNLMTNDSSISTMDPETTAQAPSVAPYNLVRMQPSTLFSGDEMHVTRDPTERNSSSFVRSNGSIAIPSHLLAPPSLQNINLKVILSNGKQMHIKTSRNNEETDDIP